MSQTDNRKIAIWLGWVKVDSAIKPDVDGWWHDPKHPNPTVRRPTPKFTTDDAAAISLLPVLVERGYQVKLDNWYADFHAPECEWRFKIEKYEGAVKSDKWFAESNKATISEAITSAVLILIEREWNNAT